MHQDSAYIIRAFTAQFPGLGLDNWARPRYLARMIDSKLLDDLAKRVAGSVPVGLQLLQEDLQKNLRSALEAGLSHMELVTREEFEIQRAVLLRTREKLEALEKQIAQLEEKITHNS